MNRQDYEHFAANLDDDAGIADAIISVAAPARSTGASGLFGIYKVLRKGLISYREDGRH